MERIEILTVKYENKNADLHSLNLRDLGESLIGLDKILTSGVWITGLHQTPRRTRSKPQDRLFQIEGTEIRTGCIEITTLIAVGSAFGSLFSDGYFRFAADAMGLWLRLAVQNAIVSILGKNNRETDIQIDRLMRSNEKLVDTISEMSEREFRDRQDERRHIETLFEDRQKERTHLEAMLDKTLNALNKPVERFVYPTKDACDYIVVPNGTERFIIDRDLVSPILYKEPLTYGNTRRIWIKIDGLTKRTRQLKVIPRGFQDRLLTAYVDDPEFDDEVASNPYLQALNFALPAKVVARYARDSSGAIKHMRISKLLELDESYRL